MTIVNVSRLNNYSPTTFDLIEDVVPVPNASLLLFAENSGSIVTYGRKELWTSERVSIDDVRIDRIASPQPFCVRLSDGSLVKDAS